VEVARLGGWKGEEDAAKNGSGQKTSQNGYCTNSSYQFYPPSNLGEVFRKKERNGLIHEYDYNAVGMVTRGQVVQSADNIDTAVSARAFRYNTLGDIVLASGGWPLDQVKREYNGFGQLVEEYQEHHGEVAEDSSKKVQYAYQYINHDSRLQSVTYPSGFTVSFRQACMNPLGAAE
jgi:hypothetical protein